MQELVAPGQEWLVGVMAVTMGKGWMLWGYGWVNKGRQKFAKSPWHLRLLYLATNFHATGHMNIGLVDDTSYFLLLPPHFHLLFHSFSLYLSSHLSYLERIRVWMMVCFPSPTFFYWLKHCRHCIHGLQAQNNGNLEGWHLWGLWHVCFSHFTHLLC